MKNWNFLIESAMSEPSWVADEDIWAKAKAQAMKQNPDDLYALTTDIYKKMGGTIKGKKQEGEKDLSGIRQPKWFYAADYYKGKAGKQEAKPVVGTPEPKPLSKPDPSAEEQVQQILIDNPNINAATLLNTIKSQGLAIVDMKDKIDGAKQEANTLSLNTPVLRDALPAKKKPKKYKGKEKAKELKAQESIRDSFVNVRLMEFNGGPPKGAAIKNKFKVALIQEGLGNLRDGFYYSADAIKSAVTAFEGKKCYADHPSRSDEQDRPERSVRDIIGHFENVHVQENDDGSHALCADLVVLPDQPYEWARALVRNAVEYSGKYPDKDFVGLSINASGDADARDMEGFLKEGGIPESCKPKLMKALEEGLTQVRVVNTIRDAISTDLVTEAGAKGRVLEIMETNKEANKMAKKDILPKEEEKMKQKHESEDEAQDAPAQDDHADAEQDKELIMDMIKKHMGDKDEDKDMDEEECGMAHEAYLAHREMGESEQDSALLAAKAMKLAKHMAAKQAESEKKESEDEAKHESEDEAEKHESEDEAKKESSVTRLEARIALLETEIKKRDLVVYVDKKLAESKLPRSVTDKIRAKKLRSEKEVDEAIKIYVEAFKEAGHTLGGESRAKSNIFVTSAEKTPSVAPKGSKISFGDMLKK